MLEAAAELLRGAKSFGIIEKGGRATGPDAMLEAVAHLLSRCRRPRCRPGDGDSQQHRRVEAAAKVLRGR